MLKDEACTVVNLPHMTDEAAPETAQGEGGGLANAHSVLGMQQRAGIIQTKAQQPHLTHDQIAKLFGVSRHAVTALLAAMTTDLQPVLRTYALDVGEAYRSAVMKSAAEGKYQGARAFLIDAAAIPRPGTDNRTLNITVSPPPGTPGYSATEAPPMLADVYDTPAGPPLPDVRDDDAS